ncbi:hypothetical protein ACQB60_06155 [Actinomycetota bacterium Odt1-20B]
MKRVIGAVGAIVSILIASLVMAPSASATTQGCGDLSNGQLCIKGPVPNKGTYTISYYRFKGGEITVNLGYEIKLERRNKIVEGHWLGNKKTKNSIARAKKYVLMGDEGCIRGMMKHSGHKYVTKWRC